MLSELMDLNYFDLHCDTLSLVSDGKSLNDSSLAVNTGALSLYDTAFVQFAVWISGTEDDPDFRYNTVIKTGKAELERVGIGICKNASDISFAADRGGTFALLSLEGGYAIESPEYMDKLFSDGIRTAALTWNHNNRLAGGAHGNGRLTALGRRVIEKMNDLGMILDVSHLNKNSFFDSLKYADRVMASHTGLSGTVEHIRNIDDEQLLAIKQKGGLVGLSVYPQFIGGDVRTGFLRAVEHMLSLGMVGNLAFGSDFDGADMSDTVNNAGNAALLAGDIARNFGEDVADRLFYKNSLLFFKEALTKGDM